MKTKNFELRLYVEIDPQGETDKAIEERLSDVVRHAVNNGLITGDSPSTVEYYNYSIVKRTGPFRKLRID